MRMSNKKTGWHIKPRIFFMFLLLLVAIFSAVFIAFNVFINNYIAETVKSQLSVLTSSFSQHDDELKKQEQFDLPDISSQAKSKIGTHTEVFVLSSNYEIEKHDESIDENELIQMAEVIKNKEMSLDEIDKMYIRTDAEDYYISVLKDAKEGHSFFVFFVNVTSIENLVDTINSALFVILIIMLAISFFIANMIANSVTKPVKQLSKFAMQIGKGDFTTKEQSFVDIEFNNLSTEMNRSAEKLEKYDAERRDFFQNVSHELRTPLMSIKCHAEGIEQNLMDKENSSRIIISETDRLSELVDDLLYISRIEAEQKPEMQENDLRETLSFCSETLKPIADKGNIKFTFDFDDAPVMLCYNEKHMTRAFLNLIANALRYAQSTITLECKTVGETVVTTVIDDGNGISKDDLPHIFERFYKGKDGKYGIGLSIVKLVVGLHDGKITVNSDKLTSFEMTFPSK